MSEQRIFTSTGSPSGFPKEWAHDGQTCTIVRELGPDEVDREEVGPMFEVRFADGETVNAFDDELSEVPA